ncbi:hypothetical protein [Corynebacterium auris]|uniref:hypothetical protein n=1 Tax=Corynebacterium auris TaxID=44750 RepID=UPI003F49431E|nr:hypothetical protein CAURIS_01265 [Corynebacterium auris]
MPSTPRRAAIAVAAVLSAVTLTACSSGDGARNAVAVGGTFQFHSPGGQTEIIYAKEERAPLPDFSGPSLMEEGEEISLSDFEGEVGPPRANRGDNLRLSQGLSVDDRPVLHAPV